MAPELQPLGFPGGPFPEQVEGSFYPNAKFFEHLRGSPEIHHLLESSAYLRQAAVDPSTLLSYMISEYEEMFDSTVTTCFLLTLLPNVTTLGLPPHFDLCSREDLPSAVIPHNIPSLVNLISDKANNSSNESTSLSKLQTILPSAAWGTAHFSELRYLPPLLRIQSVREFYAGNCRSLQFEDNRRFGSVNNLRVDGLGLGLEVVELAGAIITSEELHSLLSGMPRLRSLKLSHGPGYQVAGGDSIAWDASIYMACIQDAVGDRLEELSFSVVNGLATNENGIISMKGFTKLKFLELEVLQLLTYPCGLAPTTEELVGKWNFGRSIPRLCDLLPATIETLSLFTDSRKSNLIVSVSS